MHALKLKFKHVFLPYIVACLVLSIGYTLFHYIVILHLHWLSIRLELRNAWYPIVLVMIAYILQSHRLSLVDWERPAIFNIGLLMSFIVGISWPTICLQGYINTPGSIILHPGQLPSFHYFRVLGWVFAGYGFAIVANGFLMLGATFDEVAFADMRERSMKQKIIHLLEQIAIFKLKGSFFAAGVLININIVVFAISMVNNIFGMEDFSRSMLLPWGANYRPLTFNGQWWRLLTSIFLHANPYHAFLDIAMLIMMGLYLGIGLSRKQFFLWFFIAGILGGVCDILFYPYNICFGSTAGIFGLVGIFISLNLFGKVTYNEYNDQQKRGIYISIAFLLFLVLGLEWFFRYPVAGTLAGFAIGFLVGPFIKADVKAEDWADEDY